MASRMNTCAECTCKLKKNEIALSRKLLGRDVVDYLCIACLAEYLGCSKGDLQIKIQEFKEQGCSLFV